MIKVFKIGGNVINDPLSLNQFLKDFASISGHKILVHGGGREATDIGKKIGIESKMIDGRRVTDAPTLQLVTMVYAGLINKRIVAGLQKCNCDAVGLSGADGHSIVATKRAPEPIDFGYVGDLSPDSVNVEFIRMLLSRGLTPVFSAICLNREGGLLNCNADTIASTIAVACAPMEETSLTFCFEKPGVLSDLNDPDSLIARITPDMFEKFVDSGQISGGMIPKVSNALKAVEKGVVSVRICHSGSVASNSGTIISAS